MLAYGAGCSIGDQLHPTGAIDESTYALIRHGYAEVADKEAWCTGAEPVTDIALFSASSFCYGAGPTWPHANVPWIMEPRVHS